MPCYLFLVFNIYINIVHSFDYYVDCNSPNNISDGSFTNPFLSFSFLMNKSQIFNNASIFLLSNIEISESLSFYGANISIM